jgi:hypothetical protein
VQPEPVLGRFRWASPRTALVLGVLALLVLLATVPLAALAHQLSLSNVGSTAILAPFAIVGFVVARRVPGNPIGWILLALALCLMFSTDVGYYAVAVYQVGDHRLPLARLAVFLTQTWVGLILLLPLPIALFPDGRLPSRRWEWTIWVYCGVCALALASVGWRDLNGIFAHRIQVDSSGELAVFSRASTGWERIAGFIGIPIYLCLFLAWVGGQLNRYRHVSGEQRQQLKWLLSGGTIPIVGVTLAFALSHSHSSVLKVIGTSSWLALPALPLAIGIGILKYRLYEIDRLISRTISYAILTGLLVGVFVGIVVLATDVLPFSSPVAVAASTLAAAALFNPLRKRVQRQVDRRFNRARYDAEAIVAAFTLRLRDAVDLDTVRGELLLAVDRAVEPAHASVWIRPPVQRSHV